MQERITSAHALNENGDDIYDCYLQWSKRSDEDLQVLVSRPAALENLRQHDEPPSRHEFLRNLDSMAPEQRTKFEVSIGFRQGGVNAHAESPLVRSLRTRLRDAAERYGQME